MNIAGKVFDIYDDAFLKIASAHKEELRGVSVADNIEHLQDKDFALIIKTANNKIRKYPIHDEDSIKLSTVYFNAQKDSMHPTIRKTAEAGFKGGDNEINIDSISNNSFNGAMWRNYPLHDVDHVKEAMEKFAYTTQRMHPREKFAYARAIIKQASLLNINPEGKVLGYASENIDPISVKVATKIRENHLLNKDDKDLLQKIASNPSPERFIEFDKIAGLDGFVRDGFIPDGYETCYSFVKRAETLENRIKEIPLEKIEQLFDPEFSKEWSKDPVAVYRSLPAPTQAMIEKNAGVASAAALMLAGAASGYVAGTKMTQKAIDAQFQAKGWAKPKDPNGGIYVKDEQRVVFDGGRYLILDKDGAIMKESNSLIKLVLIA